MYSLMLSKMVFIKKLKSIGLIVILCLAASSLSAQSHFERWIEEAKDQDSLAMQIEQLHALVAKAEDLDYQDTLCLIHYALAFRYRKLDQYGKDFKHHAWAVVNLSQKNNFKEYPLSVCLRFLGDHYRLIGKRDSALYYYHQVKNHVVASSNPSIYALFESTAKAYTIYFEQKKYLEAYQMIDYLYHDSLWNYIKPMNQALLLSEAGITVLYQKHTDIDSDFMPIMNDYIDIVKKNNKEKLINFQIDSYNNISSAYLYRNENLKCIEYAQKVITSDTSKLSTDYLIMSRFHIHVNLYIAYHNLKQFEVAHQYILKAKEYFLRLENPTALSKRVMYDNLAISYMSMGYRKEALKTINDAIGLYISPDTSIVAAFQSDEKSSICNLLYDKALILQNQFKYDQDTATLEKALMHINQADSLLSIYVQELIFNAGKYDFRETVLKYYQLGLDLAYQLDNQQVMWLYTEKTKGAELMSNLAQKNRPDFIKFKSIKDSIEQLKIQLEFGNLTQDQKDILDKEIVQKQNRLLQYYQFNIYDAEQKSLYLQTVEFHAKLPPNACMIQFIAGTEQYYAILLDDKRIQSFKLGLAEELLVLIDNFRKSILNPGNIQKFQTDSRILYQWLFKEMNADHYQQYIIIPDPSLSFVPFSALLDEHSQYLIESKKISYAISANLYAQISKQKFKGHKATIISPNYQSVSKEADTIKDGRKKLAVLPFALMESQYLQDKSHGELYSSMKHESFINILEEADIFHFSGHATLYPTNEELSYLALSNDYENEKITALEIGSLQTSAQLVSLSACNTLPGKLRLGEGIFGLNRAFFQAGAKSVLSTLWEVNDQSSFYIISHFYDNLYDHHMTKDAALRQAQIDYIQESPDYLKHPYYWAAFVLHGNTQGLEKKSPFSLLFIIAASVLLFASGFLFSRRKKSQKVT